MTSFYRSSVEEFLSQADEHVIARLGIAYANRGFTSQYSDQTLTWERDIRSLRECLKQCVLESDSAGRWGLLLEFSIPRKEMRIDAVVLIRETVVIIEAKTGAAASQAKRQIEEYALLLHYFHKVSAERRIVPLILSADSIGTNLDSLNQRELFPQLASYWVAPVIRTSWHLLADVLILIQGSPGTQTLVEAWDDSPYFPIPSILEAAIALRTGLSIREIAHSEASEHEIEDVRRTVQECLNRVSYREPPCNLFSNRRARVRKDACWLEFGPLRRKQIRLNSFYERQWPSCTSIAAPVYAGKYAKRCVCTTGKGRSKDIDRERPCLCSIPHGRQSRASIKPRDHI